jgi:hypothetical protein
MLEILIDLFIFIILSFAFCVGFTFLWVYVIDKPYWKMRKRLHLKKIKKLEKKLEMLKNNHLYDY